MVIQATSPRPARTRGRHRKKASRRWVTESKRIAIAGILALLALSAVAVASLVNMAREAAVSTQDVAQPPLVSPAGPPAVAASEPPAPLFTTDDKGFVNTNARCDGNQTALALGRTAGSFVVICGETDGRFEYRGVRVSDDAMLKAVAEETPSQGFVARNSGALYAVKPTELLVTAGDTVIKQEPMLEFYTAR